MAADRVLAGGAPRPSRSDGPIATRDAEVQVGAPWFAVRTAAFVRHPDVAAVVALAMLTVLAEWPLVHGRIVGGLDSLTQFYPWYGLVASALWSGHLPGWNPHSMAGGPLAGNPLSGWTYLPAMLAFSTLPLRSAIVAFQVLHVLLATLAAYGLARALGLGLAGGALAAVAYGQSGLITAEAACCFAFASVGAWLPVLLLGAELALRADSWAGSLRGWSLAALALSQIVAAWLGQGAYYALLVFASFVVFRVLVRWPSGVSIVRSVWLTGWRLVLHGGIPVVLGLGLAAAGLLPRIEMNLLSSLAGGYAEADQQVGGWTVPEWAALVEPGYWYAGVVVAALAFPAILLARRRLLTWYLLGLGSALLLLAMPAPSPIHELFGLLPGFARLHPHLPDRIMTVFMLAPALLAGLTLDVIARASRTRVLFGVLVVGLAFADLRGAREQTFAGYQLADSVHQLLTVDPVGYYSPTPAAQFLQERLAQDGPFRYLGYGPESSGLAYTQRFAEARTVQLGVNNRAVTDRLLDVQGYDAVHLARFDAYLRAANGGQEQNYHNADIFEAGLRSPLLDLLAARYIVTPSQAAPELLTIPRLQPVFDDGDVRVLLNVEALPWAWIVHEALPADAAEALDLLHRGEIDPRQTVLIEPPLRSPLSSAAILARLGWQDDSGAPLAPQWLPQGGRTAPRTGAATRLTADAATVLSFEANRLVIAATAAEDGFLIVSEVAYPGWQATVDGEPADIYVANGLLRAVALPAGEHLVELRFASPTLQVGTLISLSLIIALAAGYIAPPLVKRLRVKRQRRQ